jgi:hypothetical protein
MIPTSLRIGHRLSLLFFWIDDSQTERLSGLLQLAVCGNEDQAVLCIYKTTL